jgi:XTP/dITP diphosphohydrolase
MKTRSGKNVVNFGNYLIYQSTFNPLGMPHDIFALAQTKKLFLGTNNRKKIIELVHLLEPRGFEITVPADFADTYDVDETGTTFSENARLKASSQAKHRGLWSIGEDSGLCVPALDGRPGIYSARFSGANANDQSNNSLLLKEMIALPAESRRAYYVSTIALSDPDGRIHIETQGECWGCILMEPRGAGGFGYDPLFEIAEYHQTFAEMGLGVKRAISHRARALRAFLARLDEKIT